MQDMLKAIRRASDMVETLDTTAASIALALQSEIIRPDYIGHAIDAHTAPLRVILGELATQVEAMAKRDQDMQADAEDTGQSYVGPFYCPQCLGSFKNGNISYPQTVLNDIALRINELGERPRQ